MSSMPTRVLIVEDHQELAANLAEFLGEEAYSLDFAADGLMALHLLGREHYDVVVLDVMLPGVSGFEVCRRLREELRQDTPVIFMTARHTLADKEQGFGCGGNDYLVKPFALRELQLRVDALARPPAAPTGQLRAGPLRYDPEALELLFEGRGRVTLSGAPAQILEQLVRHYPRYASHETLSQALWGTEDGDAASLRTHVYSLRKALERGLGVPLVQTAYGRGYRLDPTLLGEEAPGQ